MSKILSLFANHINEPNNINDKLNVYHDVSTRIWFTADTHFGAERTLTLSKRPFSCVSEMDEVMINNWNNTVDNDDIVFHLGDFGNYDIRKKLNGFIYLILGNYELEDIYHDRITESSLCEDYGFNMIAKSKTLKYYVDDKLMLDCYMTHKPIDCDKTKFNLFGHIHGLQQIKKYGLNVGVDCHYFKPISISDVLFYENAIRNHYDINVFE